MLVTVLLVPFFMATLLAASHKTRLSFETLKPSIQAEQDDSSQDDPSFPPLTEDQPEKAKRVATNNPEVETEVKLMNAHGLQVSLEWGFIPEERVDHAYLAWFYTVSTPPLTPPPNVA